MVTGDRAPNKALRSTGFAILTISIIALPFQSALADTRLAKCLILCTFGLLLTLAMGVCETWRFTARVLNDIEYRPDGNFAEETKRLYLGGANLATALFLPIFLWTAFHPATTRAYLVAAFILLIIQYIAWFLDRTETKQTWWPVVGALLGYLYPLVVSIGASIDRWPGVGAVTPSRVSFFDMCTAGPFL